MLNHWPRTKNKNDHANSLRAERRTFYGGQIAGVALQRARALAVAFKVFQNPIVPGRAVDQRNFSVFVCLQFGPHRLCLCGVVGIVGAEAGGFVVFCSFRGETRAVR
jgi:hypothetical protein